MVCHHGTIVMNDRITIEASYTWSSLVDNRGLIKNTINRGSDLRESFVVHLMNHCFSSCWAKRPELVEAPAVWRDINDKLCEVVDVPNIYRGNYSI